MQNLRYSANKGSDDAFDVHTSLTVSIKEGCARQGLSEEVKKLATMPPLELAESTSLLLASDEMFQVECVTSFLRRARSAFIETLWWAIASLPLPRLRQPTM